MRKPANITLSATTVAGKSFNIITGCRIIRQILGAIYKMIPVYKTR
jgi:hypothetical protein